MPVPIPYELARRLSEQALIYARDLAPRDTGRGIDSLRPISDTGVVGIAGADHMMIQDRGFEGFQMDSLAGKTIPIRTKHGLRIFRTASSSSIGTPRIITRDERGTLVLGKPMWTHPGLVPKNFIEEAIQKSINDWADHTSGREILRILGNTEYRVLTKEFSIGVTGVHY